jgi:hypothetical protein
MVLLLRPAVTGRHISRRRFIVSAVRRRAGVEPPVQGNFEAGEVACVKRRDSAQPDDQTMRCKNHLLLQLWRSHACPAYNPRVSHHPVHRPPLWSRIAAWFGVLAVLSALLAPVSMLAADVQSGKLGGLCSVSNSLPGGGGSGDSAGSARCDLCGSAGLALAAFDLLTIPCAPGEQTAAADFPAATSAAVPGLPFSRGPPSL